MEFFEKKLIGKRLAVGAMLTFSIFSANAQSVKPLTIIVGFPAGGSVDHIARLLADKLKDPLGRPVIVDNKPGASGRIAASQLKSMPADGSVMMIAPNTLILQSIIYSGKINYDLVSDFSPVAKIAKMPVAVAVPVNSPLKNATDLVSYAKSHKGNTSYGSNGPGSLGHLTGQRFAKAAGIEWTNIPYKGGAPLVSDLLGGHVQSGVDGLAEYIEHHRAGRLRVLGTFSGERSTLAPEVSTINEQGIKGVNTELWYGIWFPARTQTTTVIQMQNAVEKVLKDPDIKNRLGKMVTTIDFLPSEQFAQFINKEFDAWRPVIRDSGVTPD
ncbi:Bug family tripartite tricarboxylate transporter substrate binding protein [Cupriavidus sp. BIC8F]|uniref:Bug family tripartite tricarboxylate transporter substrate binding protein n=1 Tax=Cupriavidus sp. BIC8F TaxID=3079014 RepID=UPI0029167D94|nr:tripartite tricarboxylate transporter substrate-binding protein [Cupriavidus sp. BIC8F]